MSVEISIIIPTLNEVNYIERLISSALQLDKTQKEIIFVDGGSSDGTKEKVIKLSVSYPNLKLVENPSRFVSHGFNKAFQTSEGKYISLIGAHAIYPPQYFTSCIESIQKGECDVAGGFLIHQGKTQMGQAISHCMSSKFGVGNTTFRTERKKQYVESVAFAVYDRKVFDKCGLLDEELIRNQDDELHYRMNKAGFRILMLPELQVVYFVRDSLRKLFLQYYQYGYYKPLVLRKVITGVRMRHLIPPLFVLYLITLPITLIWKLWLLPLALYLFLTFFFSLNNSHSLLIRLRMIVVFPVLHLAYGTGFLVGFHILWRK